MNNKHYSILTVISSILLLLLLTPKVSAKLIDIEQCLGAIGIKCLGSNNEIMDILVPPAISLPNGKKRQWVSVGSILHDNCCQATPDGQHCKGFNPAQEFMPDSGHCVKEWRKAVYNSRDGRKWQADFGPYTKDVPGDNLKKAPARRAALFDRLGNKVGYYKGSETVSTRLLKAPSGTALDIDDVEFCESGKFVSTHSAPFIGAWGICR